MNAGARTIYRREKEKSRSSQGRGDTYVCIVEKKKKCVQRKGLQSKAIRATRSAEETPRNTIPGRKKGKRKEKACAGGENAAPFREGKSGAFARNEFIREGDELLHLGGRRDGGERRSHPRG